MSKLYAITNQKGGVGKTTTCACLGTAFTELGKKVLVVDLDPQAALTTSLGFDPDSFDKTIYNALIEENYQPPKGFTTRAQREEKNKVERFGSFGNIPLIGHEAKGMA